MLQHSGLPPSQVRCLLLKSDSNPLKSQASSFYSKDKKKKKKENATQSPCSFTTKFLTIFSIYFTALFLREFSPRHALFLNAPLESRH